MIINLRGHHLLCLQGFQGYGYDNNFVLNMGKINELRKNEDTKIRLINSKDDICKNCPNLKNSYCTNRDKELEIKKMDDEVISKFKINKEYNSLELFEEVSKIFNSIESVRNICFECKWHDECLFYQKLK